jgi:hypothetical protein
MKNLILVEGLPGTGKTTATQKLTKHLTLKGENVITLFEDDEEIPGSFYATAGIPIEVFDTYRNRHPKALDTHFGKLIRTKNYVFLRLDRCKSFIADAFKKWDMGDELNKEISVAEYISCALESWDNWVETSSDNDNIVIIDSAFMQNPINELLFRKATDDEVALFIKSIAKRLMKLNPICFYLKRDSAETAITFAKQAKGSDWSARIDNMLREIGCPDLFEHRYRLELSLLHCLPHTVCFIDGNDWSEVEKQIQNVFINKL